MPGSSPHTRGARQKLAVGEIIHRIIPAYAGSTSVRHSSSVSLRDHPRIRGEHLPVDVDRVGLRGSSPHTRGAPPRSPCGPPASTDHPRIRGEHRDPGARVAFFEGSSPHTRGARRLGPGSIREIRDHPRIRGEHGVGDVEKRREPGSSPHTRGAPPGGSSRLWHGRIIPAYAGSTDLGADYMVRNSDHPRIRGEHRKGGKSLTINKGSSPHTRGAPLLRRTVLKIIRIIPAYAGSTSAPSTRTGFCPDHPRIRGEHTWKSLQYQGSPP